MSLLFASHLSAAILYTDGNFDPANYNLVNVFQTGPITFTSAAVSTGGNPNAFHQFSSTRTSDPGQTRDLRIAFINPSFTYDWNTLGPLGEIQFSIDHRSISRRVNDPIITRFRFATRYNNVVYTQASSDVQVLSSSWTNTVTTLGGLGNFLDINGAPLDLSTGNGILQFGYRVAFFSTCNSPTAVCNVETNIDGFDNFSVLATPASELPPSGIPEPSQALPLVIAGTAFWLRHRSATDNRP